MQLESVRPAGAVHRSRTTLVAATTVLLLALAGVWATVALAIPPGGAVERRNGAAITLTKRIVPPATSTQTGAGIVTFSGTGFVPFSTVFVKLDDGAVRPVTPPSGTGAVTNDYVASFEVDKDGAFTNQTVNLANVNADDVVKMRSGKHLLRFVSDQRSIHADFTVDDNVARPETVVLGRRVTLGPGPSVPVGETPERTYDGIPKLVPGSKVPFSATGFNPGQLISLKNRDAGEVVQTLNAGPDGTASGLITVPANVASAGGASWFRVQGDGATGTGSSSVAPYAVDLGAGERTVGVGASGQRGRTVALTGSGLKKELFYLAFGAGNTGDGQTVTARIDGTGEPFHVRANDDGTLSGALPIPAGTSLGTHRVVLYVGFRAASDFPQAVFERTFEVTEFVPDPVVVTPPADTTPAVVTPPATTPPATTPPATTPKPAAPAARAPTVSSSALKATKKGRFTLSLVRPSVATKVAVSVRTKSKIRVAGRKAKKLVVLVKAKTVTLKAGTAKQRTSLSLLLTKEGRAALKKAKTLKVVVRVAPTTKGAKAMTKTVNLRG